MQVTLEEEQWKQLLALAERGAAAEIQGLLQLQNQTPGQLPHIRDTAGITTALIQQVISQLSEAEKPDDDS